MMATPRAVVDCSGPISPGRGGIQGITADLERRMLRLEDKLTEIGSVVERERALRVQQAEEFSARLAQLGSEAQSLIGAEVYAREALTIDVKTALSELVKQVERGLGLSQAALQKRSDTTEAALQSLCNRVDDNIARGIIEVSDAALEGLLRRVDDTFTRGISRTLAASRQVSGDLRSTSPRIVSAVTNGGGGSIVVQAEPMPSMAQGLQSSSSASGLVSLAGSTKPCVEGSSAAASAASGGAVRIVTRLQGQPPAPVKTLVVGPNGKLQPVQPSNMGWDGSATQSPILSSGPLTARTVASPILTGLQPTYQSTPRLPSRPRQQQQDSPTSQISSAVAKVLASGSRPNELSADRIIQLPFASIPGVQQAQSPLRMMQGPCMSARGGGSPQVSTRLTPWPMQAPSSAQAPAGSPMVSSCGGCCCGGAAPLMASRATGFASPRVAVPMIGQPLARHHPMAYSSPALY